MKRFVHAALAALLLFLAPAVGMAQPFYDAGATVNLKSRLTGNGIGDDPARPLFTSGPISQGANTANVAPAADDTNSTTTGLFVRSVPMLLDGTALDRQRSIQASNPTGNGVGAVAIAPHNAAGGAIIPVANAAVGGSLSKASATNLYAWRVTTGASAGYVMFFNSTTAPADGAVTPLECLAVAANASVGSTLNMPERYDTGLTIVFSTTGCFTKTVSNTAFIRYLGL